MKAKQSVICPIGRISAVEEHSFLAGSGVKVSWNVLGDKRKTVRICKDCARWNMHEGTIDAWNQGVARHGEEQELEWLNSIRWIVRATSLVQDGWNDDGTPKWIHKYPELHQQLKEIREAEDRRLEERHEEIMRVVNPKAFTNNNQGEKQ